MSAQEAITLQANRSLGERYTLLGQLGVGGAGEVYRAYDKERELEVGLKLLRREVATIETARVRFLREFRAISRLAHPNCLAVFDEGQYDGQYFYTMELIEGGDLQKYQRADQEVLLDLLYQVAIALAHIHNHRIVHRDLKPANILVEQHDDGSLTAKLADFGIAKLLDSEQKMTNPGAMVGTVNYMSPEQIRGDAIDPRTDLYAFGCIVFEMFTGQPPFVHPKGSFHVLRAHLEVAPPRLSERLDGVPAPLDDLVTRLLAKDPADRPQSALAIVDALSGLRTGQATNLEQARAAAFLYRPAMVGRAREREALVEATSKMHARGAERPLFATLCSPAGMGKSRLIEALRKDLQARGTTVLVASLEANPDMLFSPFPMAEDAILRELTRVVDYGDETLDVTASIEEGFVPGVEATSPIDLNAMRETMSPAAIDSAIARRRRARALVADLERLSQNTPVLLVLEDLHGMTPGALEFLEDMLDALKGPLAAPPAILLTMRPGHIRTRVRELERAIPSVAIDLEPLGEEEIEQMLGQMLGQAQDVSLLEHLVRRVLAQTEGNPLFVQAYLQNIVEQNALKRTREGWTYEGDESTGDLVPRTMVQVLTERLSMLEPTTYNVLRAASVAGRVFDFALLREVLEIDESQLLDAIDEGLRNWIIRSIPGPRHLDVYTFDHAKFVDALQEDLSPSRARSLHQRIGVALEKRENTSSQILAHHFARGDDPERAKAYLTRAGIEALEEHDHAAARDHFEAALSLLEAPVINSATANAARTEREHRELLERYADALGALGQHEEELAVLEQRLELPTESDAARARLLRKRARALNLSGQTDAGIQALIETLEFLGDSPPRHRAVVWLRLITLFLGTWFFFLLPAFKARRREFIRERALAHQELMVAHYWVNLERSTYHQFIYLQLARRLEDPAILVDAYASHLLLASLLRMRKRVARYKARAEALASDMGDVLGASRVESFMATASAFLDEPDAYKRHHAAALQGADLAGDRFNLSFTLTTGGWCATVIGDIPYARAMFERAVALGDEMESPRVRVDGLVGLCAVEVLCGEEIEASAHEALEVGDRLGLPANSALGHELIGANSFFKRDFREAAERFENARRLYVVNRLFGAWGFMIGYEYAEALLHAVDTEGGPISPKDLAALEANLSDSQLAMRGLPPFAGFYETLKGTIAARKGQKKKALALFSRARQLRERWPEHYLTAWVLQRIAIEQAHLGQPPETYEPLLERYETILADTDLAGLAGLSSLAREIIEKRPRLKA